MSTNIISRKTYDEFIKNVSECEWLNLYQDFHIADYCSIYGIKKIYIQTNKNTSESAMWANNDMNTSIGITEPMSEEVYNNSIDNLALSLKEKGTYIFVQVNHGLVDLKYFNWIFEKIHYFSWPWRAEIMLETPVESDGTYIASIFDIRWEENRHRIYVTPKVKLPADSISKDAIEFIMHDNRIDPLYRNICVSDKSYEWIGAPYAHDNVAELKTNGRTATQLLDEILAGSFDFIEYNDILEGDTETNAFVVNALKLFDVTYYLYPNLNKEISCPSYDTLSFFVPPYRVRRPPTIPFVKRYYAVFMMEYDHQRINDLSDIDKLVTFLRYIEECLENENKKKNSKNRSWMPFIENK